MARAEVRQFSCLSDNFGVLVHDPDSGATVAIDVPDAEPYLAVLSETGWTLGHILITHHHWDHVQGLAALKEATGARVVGPALSRDKIAGLDDTVEDGDTVHVGPWEVKAIATPGHTLDQISWWFPSEGIAHTGDTLFALGCGRVFEGDMEMMWASLDKLARLLPPETVIYCGHEYTAANARFALAVDPHNAALRARADEVAALRAAGRPTLPTTMARELATNPFLRARDPGLQRALGFEGADPAAVFAEVRRRKDKA
ncbi:hydroxyacylglutathione hydrolase [Polymorphum gilvum]|uniref:Hydroxyacylglutathione hydrolase n=1 Tax=Polymorphum gilvum (strain LMG 25793 / CGMCC 1.9160 / SL003B-26A1) TaxID=991905 RepID=F2J0C2_POLGS|nr:hydroxyacylglutathione hydrolase [Polymorphum gilvum]ADZ68656.1 Hydroxyacylglutathione hydrolase (Glyoxalase II) [Polymorphum gilvum SL003B-26A1]